MFRKTASGILLFLLLVSTLTLAFNIRLVKAEGGTIYIRADGSVDPPDAPIQRDGDIYTLTGNITSDTHGIVIERNNMTLDGAGYTLQGTGAMDSIGINLTRRSKVTIKNVRITAFSFGIWVGYSSGNSISGNNITNNNWSGIELFSSNNNNVSGNTITNNRLGIYLDGSGNRISGNIFVGDGLFVQYPDGSVVEGNLVNGKPLVYLEGASNRVVEDAGQVILVNCNNITISNLDLSYTTAGVQLWRSNNSTITSNNITDNWAGIVLYYYSNNNSVKGNSITNNSFCGIWLGWGNNNYNSISGNSITSNGYGAMVWVSSNNNISGNNIANNEQGIRLDGSYYNSISGNNIANNVYGIHHILSSNNRVSRNNIINNGYGMIIEDSSNNQIYHNNFINNSNQVTKYNYMDVWDDGYPSGGNYWSDYSDVDLYSGLYQNETGGDGIWDHQYVIDANNKDRYPLVNPWTLIPLPFDFSLSVSPVSGTMKQSGHTGATVTVALTSGTTQPVSLGATGLPGAIIPFDPSTGSPPFSSGMWVSTELTATPALPSPGTYLITITGTGGGVTRTTTFTVTVEPMPENQPPTCVIKLQKDGVEISEIDVGEFFDIYVGDSTDDTGIRQVRFSSDDVQDNNPTGRWTEWYDWGTSSGDWDASTKIKRWAFATPGHKEVWAEVKDDAGQTALCSAATFVPAPALPVITSPLVITPVKDIYCVGDSLEAEFTIKNIGNIPITLDVLTVGGRLNGWIPAEGAPDFTYRSVTLQPDESYQYRGSLTLTQKGNYHFFIAYYIENPTAEEKRLLDENNWNTCVELEEGLTHSDRVKNIIVFEEGTIPEEVSQLYEKIDRLKRQSPSYPPYLLDADSFTSAVATLWADFTSFITGTELTQKYDELYKTGINYDWLRFRALLDAENYLNEGDVSGAKKCLQRSYMFDKLSAMSFGAAAEVFDGNMAAGQILAEGIKDGCEVAVKFGIRVVLPSAAGYVDAFYMGMDYVLNTVLEGMDYATINLVLELTFKAIFKDIEFATLDYNTLEDYVNTVSTKVPLDELLRNSEFMTEFGIELRSVITDRVINEAKIAISEFVLEKIVENTIRYLESMISSVKQRIKSPVELRVFNSEGQVTGLVNKRVKQEIPMSLFYNQTVIVFFPVDTYTVEVFGVEEGNYGLEITQWKNGQSAIFNAINIPVSINTTHLYTVDWDTLSSGGEGVTVQVDSDNDGVFEHTFTSDSELTQREYVVATDDTPPQTWLNIGEPKFFVNDITYMTSATPIELIAEDDPGGSGVASTAYRIYNASYDSSWITYIEPFYLTGLSDGTYHIDYNSTDNAGNVGLTNTATVILDNAPPTTTLTIGEPKYVSDTTYVTPDTPFTLEATDTGSGVCSIAYRVYNAAYDSGWQTYTSPSHIISLADGVYTIEYNSTDNLGNVETTCSISVTLFSWNYVFTDSYGRGTTLKINTVHKFFQFITPDKDYGIRNATYMRVYNRAIIICHKDNELKLATVSVDTKLDFCIAYAKDIQTGKEYWLIDKVGTEN